MNSSLFFKKVDNMSQNLIEVSLHAQGGIGRQDITWAAFPGWAWMLTSI